jgi:hypothetical protein
LWRGHGSLRHAADNGRELSGDHCSLLSRRLKKGSAADEIFTSWERKEASDDTELGETCGMLLLSTPEPTSTSLGWRYLYWLVLPYPQDPLSNLGSRLDG